jgi:hypothetical protein
MDDDTVKRKPRRSGSCNLSPEAATGDERRRSPLARIWRKCFKLKARESGLQLQCAPQEAGSRHRALQSVGSPTPL